MALRFPVAVLLVAALAPLAAASHAEEAWDAALWLDESYLGLLAEPAQADASAPQPPAEDEPPAPEPSPAAEPEPAPAERPGLLAPIVPVVQQVAPLAQPVLDAAPADFDVAWLLDPRAPAEAPAVAPAPAAPEPVAVAAVGAEPAGPSPVSTGILVAGIAAASAAPAATFGWERLRRFGLLAVLYARIAKERLLDHGARERLLDRIRQSPGAPLADLARAADIPRNTAVYHLRRLEKEGLVSSVRQGRVRLYFAPGALERRENADALAALRHPTTRAIATHIGSAPGLDQRALCERTGLTPSLAHWHATRLEDAGVVQRQREGRHVRYYPGPAMRLLDA